MSDDMKFDKQTTKALLKKFEDKDKEIHYAFGLAQNIADTKLLVHKSAKGKTLAKRIQKDGKYKKIGFGTIEVKGGKAIFKPDRPVAQLAKILRPDMRKIGFKVEVEKENTGPMTPDEREQWTGRLVDLEREIDQMMSTLAA